MPIRRAFFAASASASLVALAVACGGISDPTIKGSGKVATISGALTGTGASSSARVALVWRAGKTGGYAVGADVAISGGRFSMTLETPPEAYFMDESGSDSTVSAPGQSSPPSSGSGGSGSTGNTGSDDAGVAAHAIRIKDTAGGQAGGQIGPALTVAVAGFVVYEDANGNGALDLNGSTAASPDRLLGGNKELFIADLRGGGSLDYEKLRDKSGILPVEGFNLAWSEGRWLPLNEVELKLSSSTPRLPGAVCQSSSTTLDTGNSGSTGTPNVTTGGSGPSGYPSPTDPKLHCSADGRSWKYDVSCPAPPPAPPEGLCSSDILYPDLPCAGIGGESLTVDAKVPLGWPCTVAITSSDAGPFKDSGDLDGGSFDASVD